MSAATLSVHQRAIRSSVVKKALIAITGLVLIAFLVMHMVGNLKVFLGQSSYDAYAQWLNKDFFYPVLPHGWFIWVFRLVLVACLVVHIWLTVKLWHVSAEAQGGKYVRTKRKQQTVAVRIMRWGGVALFLLILFHLLMFTTGTITPGFAYDRSDPYSMYVGAFKLWWVFLVYVVFLALVFFHVRHGFWSALTTLGANVSATARAVLNVLAYVLSAVLFLGFLLPPFAVLIGWVG